jgi:uncharacterized membrane protein
MAALELMVTFGLMILIWIIQILHYPSFHFVRPEAFSEFAQFHSSRITMIVLPLMLTEITLASYRVLKSPDLEQVALFLLVIAIWLSTFFIQVPCHNKLAFGHDREVVQKLIDTNWIRTALWSIKFFWLAWKFPWSNG